MKEKDENEDRAKVRIQRIHIRNITASKAKLGFRYNVQTKFSYLLNSVQLSLCMEYIFLDLRFSLTTVFTCMNICVCMCFDSFSLGPLCVSVCVNIQVKYSITRSLLSMNFI